MFKAFLVALLVVAGTKQICAAGCLMCNSSGTCIVADTSLNYYLNGPTATLISLSNCIQINQAGSCVFCAANYYLTPTTNTCVAVPTASLITNCSFYATATTCMLCGTGYYLNANVCTAVTTTIANCLYYSSASACSNCNTSYLLSITASSCVAAPSTANCNQYTFVQCATCASGYVLYPNNYLNNTLVATTATQVTSLSSFALYLNTPTIVVSPQSACAVQSTTNCAAFNQGINTCTSCLFGWYLNSTNMCIVYPSQPIANCLIYSSLTTCSQCISGYFFSAGVCTQITNTNAIANCATYDGTASSVQCLTCSSAFYLSSNSCIARTNSASGKITNCATTTNNADTCATCNASYVISSDGLACTAAISNCSTYSSYSSGQPLYCSVCSSGYYLNSATVNGTTSTTCVTGTVSNCGQYQNNSGTTCTLCANGYLLQSNACTAHNKITGCTTYSTSNLNTCNTCTNTSNYNFSVQNNCQNIITPILRCATYTGTISAPTCATCIAGYYLSSNTCLQVTISNCLIMNNSNQCTTCSQGYALAFNKLTCIKPYGFMTNQCAQDVTIAVANTLYASADTCNYCKQGAIAYNNINQYVCMSSAEITDFMGTSTTNTIVANCLKYDGSLNCLQCDVSSTTPFLNQATTPPSCVATCATNIIKYKVDGSNQVSQLNVCKNTETLPAVASCLIFAQDNTNAAGTFICTQCASGTIPVLTAATATYSNANPAATTISNWIPSIFAMYPALASCDTVSGSTNIAGTVTQTLISNCVYYYKDATPVYGCLRCAQGYTGTITTTYISACTLDSTCLTNTLYNLDPFINNVASCHVCSSASSIPFIAYTSGAGGATNPTFSSFTAYNIPAVNSAFAVAGGTQRNIICAANSSSTFTISSGYTVTANCGIGALLVNTNGDGSGVKFGTYCAACAPGYTPTLNGTYIYVKTACTAITNCASTGSFFNACSTCATGYIQAYNTANSTIFFNSCLAIPAALATKLTNCFATAPDVTVAANAGICKVCMKGYTLNADGYCEQYTPYQCSTGYFRLAQATTTASWGWSLFIQGQGVGCSYCNSGFSAVLLTSATNVCTSSPWVSNNVNSLAAAATVYIPNCQFYSAIGSTVICNSCASGYVINGSNATTVTGTVCYINTSLANCSIASSASSCLACVSSSFSLLNNSCVAGNIANCATYNNLNNLAAITCVTCSPNYYLNTNTNICVLGSIYNCSVLANNSGVNCSTCVTGYTRITGLANNWDYCYPLDSTLGCSAVTITNGSIGGVASCTACTSTSQLPAAPSATSNQTVCSPFTLITNCTSYNLASTLQSSNFACTACASGFYLASNACVARVNQPTKCTTYSATTDQCTACDNTSYLTSGGQTCTNNPAGILGCTTYSSATTCTACGVNTYLSSNACPTVTTTITNCSLYSANGICSACAVNFVLVNNTCVQATATNCATYTSTTACATCPAGFVLQTTNSVTSCVAMTKTGCAQLSINSPYNCLLCTGTFYLSNGACLSATAITNCVSYSSATTCSQCSQGYALSANFTSCANTGNVASYLDPNCGNSQVVSTPICSVCNAGYYFSNNTCTGNCNTNGVSGCLACNPAQTNMTCYICQSGYYQSTSGACVPVSSTPAAKSVRITGILSLLLALVFMWF